MPRAEAIPFLDLVTPHGELEEELVAIFREALRTATFVGGPIVEEFESSFASFCGSKYCVGVSSGTDALRFALMAAGVGGGEAVLTVPNTFAATAEAIAQAGALPDFVDVDESTYNMDVEKLGNYLEHGCRRDTQGNLISRHSQCRVTAVVPVHLYGQVADMNPILDLAEHYGLLVVEDACQAHGAEYFSRKADGWRRAGSLGRAAAFSFYPGKNLGACGEAGAITTNDEEIARRVRMLRNHGQIGKSHHVIAGYNGRLDAIQAGILLAKLPYVGEWNHQRRAAAGRYRHLLTGCDHVMLPGELDFTRPNYHLFVIRATGRDALMAHLSAAGVATAIHYPTPVHLQPAYAYLGYGQGSFPAAERLASQILSLPIYPHLQPEQQIYIAEQIHAFAQAASVA